MLLSLSARAMIFWIAVVLCLVAEGAILRSTLRAARAAGARGSAATPGDVPRARPALEALWAILPAAALALLLVAAHGALFRS